MQLEPREERQKVGIAADLELNELISRQSWFRQFIVGESDSKTESPGENARPVERQQAAARTEGKEEPRYFFNCGADLDPYLRALTGRIAYLGLKGTLVADERSWRQSLAKAGPVGEQLVERMAKLEACGWSVGRLGYNDPLWELSKAGKVERIGRMFSLGGYHWDLHDGQAVKRIAINDKVVSLANMVAAAFGTADAPKGVATLVAHELGHEDGILRDHPGNWQNLSLEEQRTLARRMLATETRAILTQLHVADQIGDCTITNTRFKAALQRGNLGAFIHETWGKSGDRYGSFSTLSRQEATAFVNHYIAETFGKDIYNPANGRVRAFDINTGLEKQIGAITGDAELAESMRAAKPGMRPAASSLGRWLGETKTGRLLMRGGPVLGAVGLLAVANDLDGAFAQGAEHGVGRLGRVCVDWSGFELGTASGAFLGRALAVRFAERRMPMVAIPLMILGGGMVGSHALDNALGRRAESSLSSAVRSVKGLFTSINC